MGFDEFYTLQNKIKDTRQIEGVIFDSITPKMDVAHAKKCVKFHKILKSMVLKRGLIYIWGRCRDANKGKHESRLYFAEILGRINGFEERKNGTFKVINGGNCRFFDK